MRCEIPGSECGNVWVRPRFVSTGNGDVWRKGMSIEMTVVVVIIMSHGMLDECDIGGNIG